MSPFKMPDFYVPYPARSNPHMEAARAHSKVWAREMGMIDSPPGGPSAEPASGVWDERRFDSADYALFSSYVHPDTPGMKLNVVTDWYVWLFYFDDHFLEIYKRSQDLSGAQEFLDRLAAFMPLDPMEATPMPENSVEAGLANLWSRTAPAMSEHWRARFSDSTDKVLQAPMKELYDVTESRIPNPIDYIETRRNTGGAPWSAELVEYATGAEVPSTLAAVRPMRVLKDTFADGVHLRNDIFSYQKEVLAGEINGVMVVEQFLDCDLQRAVDAVNELATSRMQQFENTALTELPLLVAEYGVEPRALQDVRSYVKGLQDWMGGDFEWEQRTGRYKDVELPSSASPARRRAVPSGIGTATTRSTPPGSARRPAQHGGTQHGGTQDEGSTQLLGLPAIGTAAARLGLRRRAAAVAWPTTAPMGEGTSRVQLPQFYMPFQSAGRNPHMDSVRGPTKAWAIQVGMVGSGLPGWDEPGYEAANIPRLTALLHPTAARPEFDLVALWSTWAMFLGDFFDEFQAHRDMGGTKVALARLLAFMPVSPTEAFPVPTNPLERGLADLWPRTASRTMPDWRRWFAASVKSIVESFQWEILNLIQNRIPDPVDYIEMRRQTCGAELTSLFIHFILGLRMPREVYCSQPMRALIDTYLEWQGLLNDVFSYQKEIEQEGEFHNGVLVVQRFLDCELQQAVALTNDLVTTQLHHFEHIVATELPALFEELRLDEQSRENVCRYVRDLQDCIAGFLEAHAVSVRYKSATRSGTTLAPDMPSAAPPVRLPSGPTGLGTAAARIGSAGRADVPSASSVPTRSPTSPSTAEPSCNEPFELPEFYLPHPPRLNPHLETAREHIKGWATQMGMLEVAPKSLGSSVWDEEKLDFMDIALLTSYTHPDASAAELELITHWYVWVFYFDNHFLAACKRSPDLAQEFLDRLPAFMPLDLSDSTTVPANPMETGLADLWPRTASAMSEHWRARFSDSTRILVRESLAELSDIDDSQVLNPIDYIEMRRNVGISGWSALLVEHAAGAEIPSQMADMRPMRVLKDSFADGVQLRNDIFTYRPDVEDEGETSNGVQVVQRFLVCTLQRAVDIVNELITSRLQQFESTALTEVPLLCGEYGLGPGDWVNVLHYVKGLQDWQAGWHEWHVRSRRGTKVQSVDDLAAELPDSGRISCTAARLGLARRAAAVAWPTTAATAGSEDASHVELPEIYMPFPAGSNPQLDAVRPKVKAWATEMGMLASGLTDWDESSFDSADQTRLAALMYPDAPSSTFEMAALWNTWAFFFADFFDETFQLRRDLVGARAFLDRLPAFMSIAHPEAVPVPTNVVERGLADLWPRTASAMPAHWRRWHSESFQRFAQSLLWEISNLIENRIPDPVDYVEMRRRTNALEVPTLLLHYTHGVEISPEIHGARPMRTLVKAVLDWHGLINDVFSYRKDVEQGEIHNGVLVVRRFLDCELQQAVSITHDFVTSRLRRFEHIVAAHLPRLADELDLDGSGQENIDRYIQGLRDLMAGLVHYYLATNRYEPATGPPSAPATGSPPTPAPAWPSLAPTGLGTAAARIGPARGIAVPAAATASTLVWLPAIQSNVVAADEISRSQLRRSGGHPARYQTPESSLAGGRNCDHG